MKHKNKITILKYFSKTKVSKKKAIRKNRVYKQISKQKTLKDQQ